MQRQSDERVMIIIWKWNAFSDHVICQDFFDAPKNKELLNNLDSGKNEVYDEYLVYEQSFKGERIQTPKSKVVRVRIVNDKDCEDCMTFLFRLIDKYTGKNGQVFDFLHRKDHYTDQHVLEIVRRTKAKKCFLIGGGRDFIYYNRAHKEGLIGEDGEFFSHSPSKQEPGIQVANDKKKRVYQPHFDKVWNHYQHEFGSKILELKTDLLARFYGIYDAGIQFSTTELRNHLLEDRNLYLRVKSFVDDGESCDLTPREVQQLEDYEKENGKSYIFDDCRRNLQDLKGIEKEYQDINSYLCDLFFKPETRDRQKIKLEEHLRIIEKEFRELVEVIEA